MPNKIPKTTPPEKDFSPNERQEEYDKFELCNACSSTDCTGLIPTPPQTEEEMESYMAIYDYQPPNVEVEKEKRE
ncbi:MAG: hypothetical protein E7393_03830 [Ruminococcaceae bacterium]|nr:hypothetical protein [Oscillospiraceae bacterium]